MKRISKVALNSMLAMTLATGVGCSSVAPRLAVMKRADRHESRLNAARQEETCGNLENAKRIYAEIHEKYPNDATCLFRLGNICASQNRLIEAKGYYRQAYVLDPDNAELLAEMGHVEFLRKDYALAEEYLEKSVKLDGKNRAALKHLAMTRGWLKKDLESLAAFRQMFSDADAIRQLAAVQAARGDAKRSQKNYDLANLIDQNRDSDETAIAENKAERAIQAPQVERTAAAIVESVAYQVDEGGAPSTTIRFPVLIVQQGACCALGNGSPSALNSGELVTPTVAVELELLLSATATPLFATAEKPASPVNLPELEMAQDQKANATPEKQLSDATRTEAASWDEAPVEKDFPPSPSAKNEAVEFDWSTEIVTVSMAQPARDSEVSEETDEVLPVKQLTVWRKVAPAVNLAQPAVASGASKGSIATAASRSGSPPNTVDLQSAFKGVCLVTLFEESRLIPANAEFCAEFQSQKYCFSSAEACEKFRKDPQRYTPVAGGLDIVSVRNAKVVEQGSINFAVWFQRKLYLFTSAEHADAFRRQPYLYVTVE